MEEKNMIFVEQLVKTNLCKTNEKIYKEISEEFIGYRRC